MLQSKTGGSRRIFRFPALTIALQTIRHDFAGKTIRAANGRMTLPSLCLPGNPIDAIGSSAATAAAM
jgi:hypothetical protein